MAEIPAKKSSLLLHSRELYAPKMVLQVEPDIFKKSTGGVRSRIRWEGFGILIAAFQSGVVVCLVIQIEEQSG